MERVVVTATVAEALAARPVTVSGSVEPEPVPAVTVPDPTVGVHVQLLSQFVTFTVNPSAVLTGELNVGVRATLRAHP